MRRAPVALLLMLLLGACSPTGVLNALAPREGITVTTDIPYGDGPRRTLDVYAPRPSTTPAPVLVFFYGGNWDSGSKAMYRFVGGARAARGVLTVIPDYRLYPEVKFPDFMFDAAAAVAWTHANIAKYGGDPRRMFFMGHSAGGQIATLLALDPRYLRSVGLSPQRDVCGVVGLAGPYDFLPLHSDELKIIFGPEAERPRSQPINYVTPQAPPMLLLAGRDDDTVDPGNTLRLAAKLRKAGDSVQDELYPGIGHKSLIAAFARPLGFLAPAREDAVRFIMDHGACGDR
jgi:acetyl esterase/lipase